METAVKMHFLCHRSAQSESDRRMFGEDKRMGVINRVLFGNEGNNSVWRSVPLWMDGGKRGGGGGVMRVTFGFITTRAERRLSLSASVYSN